MRAGSFWCDDLMYRQSTPLPGKDWRRSMRPPRGGDDDERSDESCAHDMDAESDGDDRGDDAAASVTEGAATFILGQCGASVDAWASQAGGCCMRFVDTGKRHIATKLLKLQHGWAATTHAHSIRLVPLRRRRIAVPPACWGPVAGPGSSWDEPSSPTSSIWVPDAAAPPSNANARRRSTSVRSWTRSHYRSRSRTRPSTSPHRRATILLVP